jgi:hypothetical protein
LCEVNHILPALCICNKSLTALFIEQRLTETIDPLNHTNQHEMFLVSFRVIRGSLIRPYLVADEAGLGFKGALELLLASLLHSTNNLLSF